MNHGKRMKAAMLIVIALCILCVNTVLAKVDAQKNGQEADIWYVSAENHTFR